MILPYAAVLAAHLLAVAAFLSGFFLTMAMLPGLSRGRGPGEGRAAELRRLRRLDLALTTPALAAAWAAGLTLATEGGWFGQRWLTAKIALAAALTGLHLIQSRRLRRLDVHGARAGWAAPVPAGLLVTAIVALVAAKPSLGD